MGREGLNLRDVTSYIASLYVIHFNGAPNFDDAQLSRLRAYNFEREHPGKQPSWDDWPPTNHRGELAGQKLSGDRMLRGRLGIPQRNQIGWVEQAYREKVVPRLSGVAVPTIIRAVAVSEPYALRIRGGRCVPHPRHWPALAGLVGVSSGK